MTGKVNYPSADRSLYAQEERGGVKNPPTNSKVPLEGVFPRVGGLGAARESSCEESSGAFYPSAAG